jgi:RNA polymerase sigma factor (TIGR02999 family)
VGGAAPDRSLVTGLLASWREGEESARDALVAQVYPELRRLAERHLAGERPDHTLQATALIHEAFLRLVDTDVPWADRNHFFAVAARVMRRILVDHAKARGRVKRGGGLAPLTLDEALVVAPERPADVVALDEALERLHARDARKADAIELHYFGGLAYHEVAEVLGVSPATVDRDLRMAKAWLYQELAGD